MTAEEPEISPVLPGQAQPDSASSTGTHADEERWLTYLNYDQPIQQAVRRLGALSSQNVDLFRTLLMQGRDRSRVKEYEAESIRRLQGEAFVGDEELQRALIVLTAEDPHLGEELKRVVVASGKPQELDQAIAAIRARKDAPAQSEKIAAPEKTASETRRMLRPVPVPGPAVAKPQEIKRQDIRQVQEAGPVLPRLSMVGVVLVVAAVAVVGFVVSRPQPAVDKLVVDNGVKTAAAPVAAPPPVAPGQPARPAPAVEIAMPAQSDGQKSDGQKGEAKKTPEIRPASDGPDKIAPDKEPSNALSTPAPVPGAYYKVVAGDMLTGIAVKAYRDASKFLIIQKANPSLRTSADRILVDQVIFIPKTP